MYQKNMKGILKMNTIIPPQALVEILKARLSDKEAEVIKLNRIIGHLMIEFNISEDKIKQISDQIGIIYKF